MTKDKAKKHILSLLVENEPGVLSRIAGLFSGRGFNIDSLCVSETTDPDISRITLVAIGDMMIVEQIKKQLNKLINVIKVIEFTGSDFVQREMALIKVRAKPEHRAEIPRTVDIFGHVKSTLAVRTHADLLANLAALEADCHTPDEVDLSLVDDLTIKLVVRCERFEPRDFAAGMIQTGIPIRIQFIAHDPRWVSV